MESQTQLPATEKWAGSTAVVYKGGLSIIWGLWGGRGLLREGSLGQITGKPDSQTNRDFEQTNRAYTLRKP